MKPNHLVSIIIPAHNEANCIGLVLVQILKFVARCNLPLRWELLVVDNGSTDSTAAIARQHGVKVIRAPKLGYGEACWQGVQASRGEVLLFVDGDGAVAIDDSWNLLVALMQGADLAIGVRTYAEPGSMTTAQRFGNQLACTLMRTLWGYPVQDLGPLRAITRHALDQLHMVDRDFGWTIEMQLSAYRAQLCVVEVPVRWRARLGGHSKIGGTVLGVLRAGRDIIGMLARFWWQQRRGVKPHLLLDQNHTPYK